MILVATESRVVRWDLGSAGPLAVRGLEAQRPTGLCVDPDHADTAWCCTRSGGVFRSDDRGESWTWSGLEGVALMTLAPGAAQTGILWAGSEPSTVWRSEDGGRRWSQTAALADLPSSPQWAFPPRPDTHHVRWIASHPFDADRLWVAIEAGALVRTRDGGRSWIDRVAGGPWDTHELALHPDRPDLLRVAAGDGYFESFDGGDTWSSPMDGLEVGYLRSVAIDPGDPEAVVVSASTGPRSAYVAGRSDGRLYRREGQGRWTRVAAGMPDPPSTIAPLLVAGSAPGELWAADERGVHRSNDGGLRWDRVSAFDRAPDHLRGLAILRASSDGAT